MASLIRKLASNDTDALSGLSVLFSQVVESGSSLNYLPPFGPDRAHAYWVSVFRDLGEYLHLWVWEEDGKILGTVQLAPSEKENGPCRAEVQKVMVDEAARGRGIARELLAELEAYARDRGIRTLTLDTESDSPAATVYRRLGWIEVGSIPDFALAADGRMIATTLFYKSL